MLGNPIPIPIVFQINQQLPLEPDSSRGWALVFLVGFLKERVLRVDGCGVALLREGWFNSTKGVAYGHGEVDKERT